MNDMPTQSTTPSPSMDDVPTHRIELSRTKLVALVAGSAVFATLGAWLLSLPDAFARTLGVVTAALAVLCVGYGLRKLFDRRPGLVLSPDGLEDNASAVAAGFVPWHEVTELRRWQMQGQNVLVVCVRDPDKYIRASGRLKRALNRANLSMCGSPVVLSSNSLKISFDDLEALVCYHLARWQARLEAS